MAFDNLHLEKGMYREAGKSFTQVLESLDPSENYQGTALEGTDAFQRQLKRFQIRVRGSSSDPVEKFFLSSSSAVLFPEFVSRAVRQGMEADNLLPAMLATTTCIDALDYRTVSLQGEVQDLTLARVAEGAEIPQTCIQVSDKLTKLYKRGRMLVSSYEALRFQKLDLFSLMLRQIGKTIQQSHVRDAISVLMAGDSGVTRFYCLGDNVIGGDSEELTYDQMLRFWTLFEPYKLTTMIMSSNVARMILEMAPMQDSHAGQSFHGTGTMVTPFGAQLLVGYSDVLEDFIIGMDKNYALEMVRVGDVAVEFDKLIDHQLERAAITSIAGFNRIMDKASLILECAQE